MALRDASRHPGAEGLRQPVYLHGVGRRIGAVEALRFERSDPVSTTEAVGTMERIGRILPEALAALHEVLERHRVTEEEWHAVLRFLTDVGRADEFVLLSDVTHTSVLIDAMSHAADDGATASAVEGPLYREAPPWREAPVRIYEDYDGMGD